MDDIFAYLAQNDGKQLSKDNKKLYEELNILHNKIVLLRVLLSKVDDLVDSHAPLCKLGEGYGDACSCDYPYIHERVKFVLEMTEGD